jgi:outer membrane protein
MRYSIALFVLLGTISTSSLQAESLLQIFQQAESNDPQLKIAESDRLIAEQNRPLAQAGLLPIVRLQGALNENYNTADFFGNDSNENTSLGYTVSLSMPLYDPDKQLAIDQVDVSIQQALANFESVRQNLMLRVSDAYFNVLARQDDVRFTESTRLALARQLEQTKQRFEVGLIAITDVQESQAGYDAAIAEVIRTKNFLDNSHQVLREITGRYYETLSTLKADVPLLNPDPNDIKEWVDTALKQNPAIIANQLAIETARQNIERARTAELPLVGLGASHGYEHVLRGDNNPNMSDGNTRNQIGVNVSYNLYTGGATRAQIGIAQQQHAKAIDNLEQVRRSVERQIHNSYLNVLSNISQVQALQQAVRSQETALEATQTGFDVGTRTSVDVLESQRRLLGALRDYSQARYNYVLATLQLKQAAGILTVKDLQAINGWLTDAP